MRQATVTIPLPEDLARQLPAEEGERQAVIELGLREWRIRRALESYGQGNGSLAYAAQQAGVPLREMIPLAYAHGFQPKVAQAGLEADDEQLSRL